MCVLQFVRPCMAAYSNISVCCIIRSIDLSLYFIRL